jgi:vesicle transport through interaction with t-SNAREs protein 1
VEAEGEISEMEGFLKAMEIDVSTMMSTDRKFNQQKLDGYGEEFKHVLNTFETVRLAAETATRRNTIDSENRKLLMNRNEYLDKSTKNIQSSNVIVSETEQIGTGIISDLQSQKEGLLYAQENVQGTTQITLQARSFLKLMMNRALMQKVFLLALIILLFIIIWMLIYYGLIMKKKSV